MAEFGCASRETWREVLIIAFVMNAFPISAYIVTIYRTSYLALAWYSEGYSEGYQKDSEGFRATKVKPTKYSTSYPEKKNHLSTSSLIDLD